MPNKVQMNLVESEIERDIVIKCRRQSYVT